MLVGAHHPLDYAAAADATIVGVTRKHHKRLREHAPLGGGNHKF